MASNKHPEVTVAIAIAVTMYLGYCKPPRNSYPVNSWRHSKYNYMPFKRTFEWHINASEGVRARRNP
jgi:hypothetical protein